VNKIFYPLLLTLLVTVWASAQPIGKTLPDFTLQSLSNQKVTLSELRGPSGVLVMTFWCSECGSCRASEPTLAKLSKEFAGKARVVVVASSKNDTPQTVQAYLDKHHPEFEVLMDPDSRLAHHLGVSTTTTTVILDQGGRVRYYGTLVRGKRQYAREPLKEVLAKKIVSHPRGPIFGCPLSLSPNV